MKNCWNLKLNEVSAFVLIMALPGIVQAQFSLKQKDSLAIVDAKKTESYLFPIHPGTTAILSGTMGELRTNHFHGGLDIDTPGINESVHSVQDGYISRVLASPFGYGNALYVTHPDGNTSLYAHLEKFNGAVGEFIRKERYIRKVNELDISLKPGQFPVTKGEVIALSGNTGGSGGPHLHFEVRNSKNEAINPLLYNFTEVKDNVSPLAFKIALKTLDETSRVNDQFGRYEFSVTRTGSTFTFPQPILAHGKLVVEVLAHDKMQDTRFVYGIPYIEMLVDSQLVFTQTIDKVNFDETRRILTLMDFKALELKGSRFNKLYVDDGNKLEYYKPSVKKQAIEVTDKERHVVIRLKDYEGNVSQIKFTLKPTTVAPETPFVGLMKLPYEIEVQENILKVTVKTCFNSKDTATTLWAQGKNQPLHASYKGKNQNVFLTNLDSVLPDSITTCQGTIKLNLKDRIPSETEYKFYSDWAELGFSSLALYDTLYLSMSHDTVGKREVFYIGNRLTPLHKSVEVTLKPMFDYKLSRDLGVYRKEGRGYNFLSSQWQGGKVKFYTPELGEFTFLRDSIPPTITKLSVTNTSVRLKMRDNLSGIAYYEANINGQWLLMIYDYKTGIVRSERLDDKKLLSGDFELKVVDNAGNEAIYKQKL